MKEAAINFILVLAVVLVVSIGLSVFLMFMAFIVFGSLPEILINRT